MINEDQLKKLSNMKKELQIQEEEEKKKRRELERKQREEREKNKSFAELLEESKLDWTKFK
ncbi:YqkE family protein [Bacillus kexueae]|uniref:YqkE family protein n=1 Tax=Aeribacillus kexueae TaxID=2078952 RepID=UPI001FAFD931|nr:YqkE family protein [Bacillus kexueae]